MLSLDSVGGEPSTEENRSVSEEETDGLNSDEITTNHSHHLWTFFGHSMPKPEIIYFSQVIIIYIVVITSLANITYGTADKTVFISLLCSCLGYLLPNPSLPKDDLKPLNTPAQPL